MLSVSELALNLMPPLEFRETSENTRSRFTEGAEDVTIAQGTFQERVDGHDSDSFKLDGDTVRHE